MLLLVTYEKLLQDLYHLSFRMPCFAINIDVRGQKYILIVTFWNLRSGQFF